MPAKRRGAQQLSVKALLREKIAKKERKQAKAQVQEQVQEQVAAKQVELQARYAQLQLDHDLLKKQQKNQKKSAKRKLQNQISRTVVHGSASCEMDDENVLAKHDLLMATPPGTSEALDKEKAADLVAQEALRTVSSEVISVSSSSDDSEVDAETVAQNCSVYGYNYCYVEPDDIVFPPK